MDGLPNLRLYTSMLGNLTIKFRNFFLQQFCDFEHTWIISVNHSPLNVEWVIMVDPIRELSGFTS